MPFIGDTFTRTASWVNNDALGIKIRADLMDTDTNDIAYGLSQTAARITALASGPFTGYVSATPLTESQTATAGQTVLTIATFAYSSGVPGAISIYVNGIKLPASEINQTSNTSVTLATALAGGEQIELISGGFSSIMGGKVSATHANTTGTDGASYQFHRNASYTGGTPGYVNACIWGETTVAVGATSFEWTGLFVMNNYAAAGENVGLYAQGNKYAQGPTWAATLELIDRSGADPLSSSVALEVDMSANGTDVHNSRVLADLVYRRQGHTGAAMECAFGLRFNSDDPDLTQALLKTAIGFTAGAHVQIGIDFSPATIFGAAAKLANGQVFQWGNGTGAAARQFTYTGSALVLQDASGTNPALWQMNDNGTLLVQGKQLLSVGGVQTGWVLMTGTRDHTTAFAVSTVTQAQLASRVAALEFVIYNQGMVQP